MFCSEFVDVFTRCLESMAAQVRLTCLCGVSSKRTRWSRVMSLGQLDFQVSLCGSHVTNDTKMGDKTRGPWPAVGFRHSPELGKYILYMRNSFDSTSITGWKSIILIAKCLPLISHNSTTTNHKWEIHISPMTKPADATTKQSNSTAHCSLKLPLSPLCVHFPWHRGQAPVSKWWFVWMVTITSVVEMN